MSTFRVPIEIADRQGGRFERLNALVDTGAAYTWVPSSILVSLGHEPEKEWDFVLADDRRVQYGVKWITVRVDGQTHPTPVVFGDDGSEPLLGVVTLEESRLGVDAVNERLIPTLGLLKRR